MSFQESNNTPQDNYVSKIRKPGQDKIVKEADKPASLSEDYTYFGVTKTQSGNIENALAFKIRFKDGTQNIIQYHELISPFRFNGSDLIELATTTLSIKIRGKRLEPILDHLAVHRLTWMKEHDNSFPPTVETEPVIQTVTVHSP